MEKNIINEKIFNEMGDKEIEIDLMFIIEKCPSIIIVRKFLEANLNNICDSDEEDFLN